MHPVVESVIQATNASRALAREATAQVLRNHEQERLQIAAYLLAEEDGFRASPERYWFRAEKMLECARTGSWPT